jgi:hypothetical protein
LHFTKRKAYSAGNYQLLDEESTGRMIIPQGITSSWIRNPPEEWLFRWNDPHMDADSDRQDQCVQKNPVN